MECFWHFGAVRRSAIGVQSFGIQSFNAYVGRFFREFVGRASAGHTQISSTSSADSYKLDPDAVARAITSETKAVMTMHLFGRTRPARHRRLRRDAWLREIEQKSASAGAEAAGVRSGPLP